MNEFFHYQKGNGDDKNWIIEETSFHETALGKCEAVLSQGNGYLGLRNSLEEQYIGETRGLFVSGTFNKADPEEVTELPNLPDITNFRIWINGNRFDLTHGEICTYSRTLNLKNGETVREVLWQAPTGEKVKLVFRRFVSMDNLHMIAGKVDITAKGQDVKIKILSGIDGVVSNSGTQHMAMGNKQMLYDKYLYFPVTTRESKIPVVILSTHLFLKNGTAVSGMKGTVCDKRRQLFLEYCMELKDGETISVEKFNAVHTGRDLVYWEREEAVTLDELKDEAEISLRAAEERGYDRLFSESAFVWNSHWEKQDVVIKGSSDFSQVAIRYALYHLNCCTNKKDPRIGIGAKGLSGEGYKGHSFWDTETFILPYFMYTQQEVARTLLTYRYLSLDGAREKAKKYGCKGAMYPWESAWITDGEVTPDILGVDLQGNVFECLTGKLELHITADIAVALWQYYQITGDTEFMEKYGYEILLDTAIFWNSRMTWNEERKAYEILDVIGPDEYKEHVDNDAYTNYMARENLILTHRLIKELRENRTKLYQKFDRNRNLEKLELELEEKLNKLYLPKPREEDAVIPQCDGYFELKEVDLTKYKESPVVGTIYNDYTLKEVLELQAAKQADVVELLYALEDEFDEKLKESNYWYYEKRTLHDSSLSKAIYAILANDIGLQKEAYEMFLSSAITDLGHEPHSSDAGIHAANMGGIWQDVVMGFGGVRLSKGILRIRPGLPEEWESITFHLVYRGRELKVTITKTSIAIINKGTAFSAIIYDGIQEIKQGINQFSIETGCTVS